MKSTQREAIAQMQEAYNQVLADYGEAADQVLAIRQAAIAQAWEDYNNVMAQMQVIHDEAIDQAWRLLPKRWRAMHRKAVRKSLSK